MAAEILVIAAHPQIDQSRVTRRLMTAVAALPEADPARSGARIELRDLYRRYPDYYIDVAAEQAALRAAKLVVWLHPVHWYSMPPLMKLWLDEVFAFGWAYGPGGDALRDKDLWLAASTGGPEQSYRPDGYNRYFFDAFLHPYEQTAALAHMRWLPPLVLHGAHRVDGAAIDHHALLFAQRLQQWPDWPEIAEMEQAPVCDVPADARPEPAAAAAVTAAAGR
jgi:glutathione-regulated potassium-efflux system ancillary protein KefF